MDEAARAAIDQRERGRDRSVGRGPHAQCLNERDPQREARLGIVGEALARGAVDQVIEIGQATQRLGRDRMGEGAILRLVEVARRGIERRFERKPLAQDRIEQAQRRPARLRARRIGRSWATAQSRRLSGSSADSRTVGSRPSDTGGALNATPLGIAINAAMRFSVDGWVENRLSPRPRPGTM